jgi:hypothetical protein
MSSAKDRYRNNRERSKEVCFLGPFERRRPFCRLSAPIRSKDCAFSRSVGRISPHQWPVEDSSIGNECESRSDRCSKTAASSLAKRRPHMRLKNDFRGFDQEAPRRCAEMFEEGVASVKCRMNVTDVSEKFCTRDQVALNWRPATIMVLAAHGLLLRKDEMRL